MRPLPSTVRRLGLVSLLTDASSEMIYPLLPSFLDRRARRRPRLRRARRGPRGVGGQPGSRSVSGGVSDRMRRRKPLIVAGYALVLARAPAGGGGRGAVARARGARSRTASAKGVRGAPRDALLAQVTPREDLGRAFGFQRAMDHAGAVAGPLIASALLLLHLDLRTVFALAAVPALASVLVLVFGVREAPPAAPSCWPADVRPRPAVKSATTPGLGPPAGRDRPLHARQLVGRVPAAARAGGGRRPAPHPDPVDGPPRREVGGEHGRGRAVGPRRAGARPSPRAGCSTRSPTRAWAWPRAPGRCGRSSPSTASTTR